MLARSMLSSCVRRFVCLTHAGIVSKRLNVELRKQRRTIGQGLLFSDAENLGEILTRSPPMGAQSRDGVGSKVIFDQYLAIHQKRCEMET